MSIPHDGSLRGAQVWVQSFTNDPGGPFAGLTFSGGLRLTLGD